MIKDYTFYAKLQGGGQEFVKQEIERYKQMIPKLVEEIIL